MISMPQIEVAGAATPQPGAGAGRTKVAARDVNVYYGEKQALNDVTVDIPEKAVTAVYRAFGLRKIDVPALYQPHERYDPDRTRNRGSRDRRAECQ